MTTLHNYETAVTLGATSPMPQDIHENEQAVQAFTQTPASNDPNFAHELFLCYTAEIMLEQKVFTR